MAEGVAGPGGRLRLVVGGGGAVLLVLPWILVLLDEPFFIGVCIRFLAYALAAAALDLILGYGGLVSFGQAAFFGIGAYTAGVMIHHATEGSLFMAWPVAIGGSMNALLALPLAGLVAAVLAAGIGVISLRTGGVYFIMITLAFAQMVYFIVLSFPQYGGTDGLMLMARNAAPGLDLADETTLYYVSLAALAAFLWFGRRLAMSRFGMVLRGARENERRMRALGFPIRRYRLAAFVISGAVTGIAGALLANQSGFVSPDLLSWQRSGEIMVMVVLGGMGTLFGPVLGAISLLLLEEVLQGWTEHWMLVLGPLLLGVVLFTRGGLWGALAGERAGDG